MALHDGLTGLPNRTLLTEKVSIAIAEASGDHGRFAVFIMDMDGFKDVNDNLGHQTGDDMLRTVARRIKEVIRSVDTVARLGGDEFALLSPDSGHGACRSLASELRSALGQPIQVDGSLIQTSASIGAAVFPSGGSNARELLHKADLAMYHAKRTGCGFFLSD